VNVDVRVRGRDGRLYPARPLTREERNQARWLAHHLVHGEHLSIRVAQQVMADRYGIRRAVGTIHDDLVGYGCPHCNADLAGYQCPHCAT
jgi:hypothetical protein